MFGIDISVCHVFSINMPKGPEREHFDGLFSETCNTSGKTRHFWRCKFCSWELGGKNFQNNKARVHLSGDPDLRNGLISRVCARTTDIVKVKFTNLEKKKRQESIATCKAEKRKRAMKLLYHNKQKRQKNEQSTLFGGRAINTVPDDDVDTAWGEFFFGLDVPVRKISHPLFRHAIDMTRKSGSK